MLLACVAALAAGCGGHANPPRAWTELTWKCEDEDADGHAIGPVIVSNANDARDYDGDWHTRPEARAIAKHLQVRFSEDC